MWEGGLGLRGAEMTADSATKSNAPSQAMEPVTGLLGSVPAQ